MIVVSLSTLIKIKGIDIFIDSHKYLKNKNYIIYKIYGDGPLKNKLELKKNSSIKFMGFTNTPEDIIKNSDIVVIPTIIPESFSLVALEAINNGIPVVTTNIGGQSELVINNYVGLHYLARNPKSLASKIDILFENPRLYKELSNNCINYSKKYSYNIFKNNILEVFNSVMV